jgi:hypothetical protein
MIAADEIRSRARDYRKNIAPEGVLNNPLSYDEEVQHLQIKLRIIDRLAKDAGKSLDDHQLFTVAVSHAMQAVADRLSGDSLLKAAFTDLATNVELVCRSPISDVQLNQLSRAIYDAGGLYYQKKYFVHAIACYSQAQRGFRKTGAFDEEREAEYRLRLSTWRAQRSVLRLITGFWSGLLFGFGFRPYRVLWAIVVVILLFGLAYRKLIATHDTGSALFISAYAYFGMLGKGDIINDAALLRLLTVVESFVAVVLNSTLVALLAKRWFRL